MFFSDLDPADVNPWLFVNRDAERKRLADHIEFTLENANLTKGKAWAIIGEKGVGKSIFSRAIIKDIKERRSSNTLIVTVDCRRQQSWRKVLSAVASATLGELQSLRSSRVKVPDALFATVQLADTLARFDDVEIKRIHEHIQSFKAAVKLGGDLKFLNGLSASFGIDLERSTREIEGLTGRILVDEDRLSSALCDLFADVREAGFDVVLYLDNIDELDHDYSSESALTRVRRDIEGLLKLCEAPIIFLLNMRTYFSRVLRREILEVTRLDPLEPDMALKILARRLESERPELKDHVQSRQAEAAIAEIARRVPTPFAFLLWVKFVIEEGFIEDANFVKAQRLFFRTRFSTIAVADLQTLVKRFERPDVELTRDELVKAVGDTVLKQCEELQIVLPVDFWSPTRFTLAPILHFAHPSWDAP